MNSSPTSNRLAILLMLVWFIIGYTTRTVQHSGAARYWFSEGVLVGIDLTHLTYQLDRQDIQLSTSEVMSIVNSNFRNVLKTNTFYAP